MLFILKLIRVYFGGKTEFGLLLAIIFTIAFVLPVWPWLTMDVYISVISLIGAFAGSAFLSKIEKKEGTVRAFLSLLTSLQKAFKKKN